MDETKLLSVIGRWRDKSSPKGSSDQGSGDTDGEGKVEGASEGTSEGALTSEPEGRPREEGSTKEPSIVVVEEEDGKREVEPRKASADGQGMQLQNLYPRQT